MNTLDTVENGMEHTYDMQEWITPGDAARRNNELYPNWTVTPKTVLEWAKDNRIPSQQRRGRFYYVKLADVIAYNVPPAELNKRQDTQGN